LYDKIWKLWQSETEIFYQIFGRNSKTQSEPASNIVKKSNAVKTSEPIPKVVTKDSESMEKKLTSSLSEERTCESIYENLIKDYFQLNVSIAALYKTWSEVDSNFQLVSTKFEGIRLLRQDPVENLFSFICSSNNHISRISSMIEKLCENYGQEVGQVDGKAYFSFPTVSELSDDGVESELRNLGFGYR
jgi:N-glycosylase/DNA lyase